MRPYCRHTRCVADAVANLLFAADRLPGRRAELEGKARGLIGSSDDVPCLEVPRKGPLYVPFCARPSEARPG